MSSRKSRRQGAVQENAGMRERERERERENERERERERERGGRLYWGPSEGSCRRFVRNKPVSSGNSS